MKLRWLFLALVLVIGAIRGAVPQSLPSPISLSPACSAANQSACTVWSAQTATTAWESKCDVSAAICSFAGLSYTGTAPLLAGTTSGACGTAPALDAKATNFSGTATVGTGTATSCTITFASGGFTTYDHCTVAAQVPLATFAYSYTKTTITFAATSLLTEIVDYRCDGV
jgi:hypothetical protein